MNSLRYLEKTLKSVLQKIIREGGKGKGANRKGKEGIDVKISLSALHLNLEGTKISYLKGR
jgi:hypothetical protein